MINFLEYLYRPFIETCFFFYNLVLFVFYIATNKKITDKNKHSLNIIYYDQKTTNESKINSKKWYLLKNFPWVIKLSFVIFILWFIYKIIVSLGLVEIVKLFIK